MPDINDPFAQGFFFAGSDPANLKMREKIALAQMMQKKKVPTNLGEGIYSVGESIANAMTSKGLMDADKEAQVVASKLGAPKDAGDITPVAPSPPGPQVGMPTMQTAELPPVAPAAPAVPLPPDQQQSYEPGAPVRLQGSTFGKPPVMPPPAAPTALAMPPAGPQRPSVADFGQKPVLAPTPPTDTPVMAQGGDDPRRAIALTMLRQGQTGQPQSPAFAPTSSPTPAPAPVPPPPTDQGIKPAPPPPPPPQQQRPYVPPEAALPQNAPIEAPTRREMELRTVLNANQGNPYAAQSPAATELKQLEEARAKRQLYADERFKAQISQANEQNILRQKGLMDEEKRTADVAHTQAQTRKESVTDTPEDKFVIGADGIARPLQISGTEANRAPPLPKNEAQLKALKHHELMSDAEKIVGEGKALRGGFSATGSQVPIVGGWLQSDAYRRERSAAERWVINKLRPESGATIGEKEMDREVKAYFPQPSDDAKTIADKTIARRVATEGMLEASGREGKKYMEWKGRQAAEADAAKQTEISEAKQWLNDHPNDPRAAKVRQRLGL